MLNPDPVFPPVPTGSMAATFARALCLRLSGSQSQNAKTLLHTREAPTPPGHRGHSSLWRGRWCCSGPGQIHLSPPTPLCAPGGSFASAILSGVQ